MELVHLQCVQTHRVTGVRGPKVVEFDNAHSTVCLVLLWQIGIWQYQLGRRAKWWNMVQLNLGPRPPRVTLYCMKVADCRPGINS